MGIYNVEPEGPSFHRPPTLQPIVLSPLPSSATPATGDTTPVTPVVERKLHPRATPRLSTFSPGKNPQLDQLAEGNPLSVKPARSLKRASTKRKEECVERGFTPVHKMEGGKGATQSPSSDVALDVEGEGDGGSELGQGDNREGVGLGIKRKRKMEATTVVERRVSMRKCSRLASEEAREGEDGGEYVTQKAISAGTLGKRRAEASRLQETTLLVKGKEIEGLTKEGEDMVHVEHVEHVEQKTTAQPMLSVGVRGKFCELRPLLQKKVTEAVGLPAEGDSWSVQSDLGVGSKREIEDTRDELQKQKDKGPEMTASEGSQDDGYILSWNEYTMDNILANQNAQPGAMTDDRSRSPYPPLYTPARRDSGVSFGGNCVVPQLLTPAPHAVLLLRGGEASTMLMSPPSHPSEHHQFGLNDQYEERELYQSLGGGLGKSGQELGAVANQTMEGIWKGVFRDAHGQAEDQLDLVDVQAVKPESETQLNLELGLLCPDLPEEAEYPVLYFAVPPPFGDGARDDWDGESEAGYGGWSPSASNETVEIPEPGPDKSSAMVWNGEKWQELDERDSLVCIEQDWGKWTEGVRGPYGQEDT